MSSNTKSKSNGLRILWIPGRKKNHHKGKFDTTSKRVEDYRKPKKNEPWSLGGNRGQHELIKSDISTDVVGNSLTSSLTIPMAGAAVTNVVLDKPEEKILLEQLEQNKDQTLSTSTTDLKVIIEKCEPNVKLNQNGGIHNHSIGDDVDSIENFTDEKSVKGFDETESVISPNSTRKKKKKNKKNKKNSKGEEVEEEKTVKCLYFALMCCECSIS